MPHVGPRAYDLIYRVGAPWEGGPRGELVHLVDSGRLTPKTLSPGRAIDLGCGGGANLVYLAQSGFTVTGVDFSSVALRKAAKAVAQAGVQVRLVQADLTRDVAGVDGTFDLLVDYGTLDDLPRRQRPAMAALVARLARPGAVFLLWCFLDELPWWRRRGARFPGLRVGEVEALFGEIFTVERMLSPAVGSGFACYLLSRRPWLGSVSEAAKQKDVPLADGAVPSGHHRE